MRAGDVKKSVQAALGLPEDQRAENIGPVTKALMLRLENTPNHEEWEHDEQPVRISTVGGRNIYRAGSRILFSSGMTINGDGSPHCYHPVKGKGLDYTENAGGNGYWWGIATDSRGKPYIQRASDPAPGYYVSTTAMVYPGFEERDPRRYVDSETVPFIVIPGGVQWAKLGMRARVTYKGKTAEAIVADIGPRTKIGEGSIALADLLGIKSNPKTGGVSSGVDYAIFT